MEETLSDIIEALLPQKQATPLTDQVKEELPTAKNAPKEYTNKQQPSLIPFDILLKYLEPAYQEGLIRYFRDSWRLGFKTSDMYDATIRHLTKFFYCHEDWDADASKVGVKKHHLAGVLFSVLCMLDTFEHHPELDDRKTFRKETQNGGI